MRSLPLKKGPFWTYPETFALSSSTSSVGSSTSSFGFVDSISSSHEINKTDSIIIPLNQILPSAYHIYVIKLNLNKLPVNRKTIFDALKAEGIGVNVHYLPIHLHPFYRDNFNTKIGQLPIAEMIYESIITLPLYPTMEYNDIMDVINALEKVINYYLY